VKPTSTARRSVLLLLLAATPSAAGEPRGRDLGIPFDFGKPGRFNAITDVAGVEVGHVTLVEGDSVRTGVTAILPRGKGDEARRRCFAGFFALNGNGDMTGTHWIEEIGLLEGPVMITNTNAVGVVRDAVIAYAARRFGRHEIWSLPVVAETWDEGLNDMYGGHVKAEHAVRAIETASSGPVAEGSVGGGTGMRSYGYKSGIGTASRVLAAAHGGYVVGVLVQSNLGSSNRRLLRIGGIPVGEGLPPGPADERKDGSIIVIVATDAPLLPHQLKRLARRVALGQARTGAIGADGSGDIYLAFSTANPAAGDRTMPVSLTMLPSERMDPLSEAVIGATEEAIVNSLVAGRSMTGYKGHSIEGLPHDRVKEILARHGRLARD
jgi:L-aminopeptidase/D-esterase-like protein